MNGGYGSDSWGEKLGPAADVCEKGTLNSCSIKVENFLCQHSATHFSRTDVFHAVSLPLVFRVLQHELQCKSAIPRWDGRM